MIFFNFFCVLVFLNKKDKIIHTYKRTNIQTFIKKKNAPSYPVLFMQ